MTETTTRIFNITMTSRDKMIMEDSLTGGGTIDHPNPGIKVYVQ